MPMMCAFDKLTIFLSLLILLDKVSALEYKNFISFWKHGDVVFLIFCVKIHVTVY